MVTCVGRPDPARACGLVTVGLGTTADLRSNTFEMEWPPRSGNRATFPEVDCAAYFLLDAARTKINPAQVALLDELARLHDALDPPAT